MSNMKHVLRALLAITSLALSWPGPAQAQVDRDTQEINSYVLTEAGLARFTKASKALGALRKQVSGGCEDEDDGDNPKNIDQLVAKFNATPGAKAALQGAGMTTREFIVFSMSIFQTGMASWALSQPGGKLPPGMSMANINFYRQHEAAMAGLNKDSESDDCNSEESEDEPVE
jgi:hypothetical protein